MIKKSILFSLLLLVAFAKAQVIPAPDLQCVTNNAVSSNVVLSWTNPTTPCGGAFVGYNIYVSSTKAGPYTLVATVTTQNQQSYVDVSRLSGGANWFYYMEADYNCPGFTRAQSDTIENRPPTAPNIINVDVQPDNSVVFNWEPSSEPQVDFYRVYYLPGIAVPITDVQGRFNTTYIDNGGANPSLASVRYTISASDSCNGLSSFNTAGHATIFLSYKTSSCERSINLNWTRYENWPQGVKEYRIIVSKNLSAFTEYARVDSAVQTYTYSGFDDGDSLCITVEAISAADTNITSHSNYQCFTPSIVQSPDYIYLINATVGLDNLVSLSWLTDPQAELLYYQVDVSGNGTTFDFQKQFLVPSPLTQQQDYIDSLSTPQNNALFYRVRAIDSCNLKFNSVDSIKTIHLSGELFDYYLVNLVWNDFVAHGATILYWNLYRNKGQGYQLIKTFAPGLNELSDSLQPYLDDKGLFCYRIEAVYDIDLPGVYRDTLSSFSNEICIDHRPIIYIPNAFAPYGVNRIFKPTIIFGSPQNYSMTIWNRWGAKIFESNDPDLGWDGTQKGSDVQMGAYGYLIKFVASDGTSIERKGMVMLVK